MTSLTKQQDFSISWCPREKSQGWCLPICLPKLHMPQLRTSTHMLHSQGVEGKTPSGYCGTFNGKSSQTPVRRTARRGWTTGKTNISNKEQVWMGWIHPSLTPTDHLFDCAHCRSSYKLFYNQGWLTIWHYLFLAGQNNYNLFPHQVADFLVLFVSGRPEQLWPIPPTPEWLIIWHYVFLAGHMTNCGGWRDSCKQAHWKIQNFSCTEN